MTEERKEVKRIGNRVINMMWKIALWISLILCGCFVIQLMLTIRDCIGSILPIAGEEYTLTSSFVANIILKVRNDGLYETVFNATIQVRVIFLIVAIVGIISILSDYLLPMDCHYIILWHGEDDCFFVSFPDAYELRTPIKINMKFQMDVSKKCIKIDDGNTILQLPYDKGAEELLRKLQKR